MPDPPMMPRTACVILTPLIGLSYASFAADLEERFLVIASEAKQSIEPQARSGLLRRCAPRNDDWRIFELRRLRGAKLAGDHALQRHDRLEILRRDLGLRNGEIELGFDAEHQIDNVHRGQ